ncbi:MAG: HAMP domain-containing histidine kinase [Phormidesmis sp. RL_2_1]|nr:HAMP domain-containing histidine kinase [Phormidesmis sp. RL_2_1]
MGKGTGIGLSISHTIVVKNHGGQLTFTSIPRQGAEFVIQLPVLQVASAAPMNEFVLQPPVSLSN